MLGTQTPDQFILHRGATTRPAAASEIRRADGAVLTRARERRPTQRRLQTIRNTTRGPHRSREKQKNRCLGGKQCASKSELLETRRHGRVIVCFARLAPAPLPSVLADVPPPRIPCICFFADCAGRCSPLRTPCIRSFSYCARIAPASIPVLSHVLAAPPPLRLPLLHLVPPAHSCPLHAPG